MSLRLSVLLCLTVLQLCVAHQPKNEADKPKKFPLLGGWHESSPDSEDVKKAAHHALTEFNTLSRSHRVFKLLTISNAYRQVTNGINFKFDAVLGKTKCKKTENHDLNSCSLAKKQLKCHFKVFNNFRKNRHELQGHKCSKNIF
ncbi:cystatin-SN isoform 1-T2 [Pholidichthys leucotaenia]